jgi:hypothetical protein
VIPHLPIPEVRVPIPSHVEGAFVKVFVISMIILTCVLAGQVLVMPLEAVAILGPGAFLLFSLLLLTLNSRFKSSPEMSQRAKFSSDLHELKSHIRGVEVALNHFINDKSNLEQGKNKRIGEITDKRRETEQLERNAIGKVEIDLKNILSGISSKKQGLAQSEAGELANALENIQAQFLYSKLSQHSLTSQSVPGIGVEMTKRLLANGIKTAADIGGGIRVKGIGPKKVQDLLSWRGKIESNLRNYAPKSLPQAQENTIRSKYLPQLQSLDAQESDARRHAGGAKDAIIARNQKEKATLQKKLDDTRDLFSKELKDLDDKIAIEKKRLSEKKWAFERVTFQLKPYHKITFSSYLKRALLF